MTEIDRRKFLAATSAGFAALAVSACSRKEAASPGPGTLVSGAASGTAAGYGALASDPVGLLDLPAGFSYRLLSSRGDTMSDGGRVPDAADGMGCIALPGGKLALVRNHELTPGADSGGAAGLAFDRSPSGTILPGGTTTIVLDAATLAVERQFRSLSGTIRNCAGGVTPWGSWLTCEEDVTRAGSNSARRDHGWVFEVPAAANGPVDPLPHKAMGRFKHEAAAVDPASGHVYMTEDMADGLLYRFVPAMPGQLAAGGRLQALAVAGLTDSRNWDGVNIAVGQSLDVLWIDLDQPESPGDDLRKRGLTLGAMRFARGEGIHTGTGELYFTCTSGGALEAGQIFRLTPGTGGSGGRLQLFFEATDKSVYNYGDNLTVAPDGQLIVCEDQGGLSVDNHLRGISRDGRAYPFARLRIQTELAGACFSPDGKVLFVNVYSPTRTLAITGPWAHLQG